MNKREKRTAEQYFNDEDTAYFLEELRRVADYYINFLTRIKPSIVWEDHFSSEEAAWAHDRVSYLEKSAAEFAENAKFFRRLAKRKSNPCAEICDNIASWSSKAGRAYRDELRNARAAYKRVFRKRYRG